MLTVSSLVHRFWAYYDLEVTAGNVERATADGHRYQLKKLLALVVELDPGRPVAVADLPAGELTKEVLARAPSSRHFRQSVERLYSWAHEVGAVPANPVGRLPKPATGQRERVMTRRETARILAAAPRPFRLFLLVQLHTLMRPGELRQLRWAMVDERARLIRLTKFKAMKRRRDKLRVRYVAVDRWTARLLGLLRRNRRPGPKDLVFPSRRGSQLTCQAVRLAMHRACERAGIDQTGERIVCYSVRHTGATNAGRNEVRDKRLAELLGHTSTAMTGRYLHFDCDDLIKAIDQANTRKRTPPGADGAIAGRLVDRAG